MHWKEGRNDVFAHAGYEWVFAPRKHMTMTLVEIRGITEEIEDRDPEDVTLEEMPDLVRRFVVTHHREYHRQRSTIAAAMGVINGP